MATTSPFDPDKIDPDYYSKDPNQHGNADYGHTSEGVGTNEFTTSGMDMNHENSMLMQDDREASLREESLRISPVESLGGTQEWDVDADAISEQPKGHLMSDEAAKKLSEVAENPSDDALLHRADATYLEEGDNPNAGYDPHHVGYEGKDKTDVSETK